MLVTQLETSITDNSLIRLSEHKASITPNSTATDMQKSFVLTINGVPGGTAYTVRTSTGLLYSDTEHTTSLGQSASVYGTIYYSSDTEDIMFDHKYNITSFTWNNSQSDLGNGKDLLWNVDNLTYWRTYSAKVSLLTDYFEQAVNLTYLDSETAGFSGDIAKLKNLELLTSINVMNSNISGSLADMPENLTYCVISNSKISGSYSDLGRYVNLTTILLRNLTITGTPQDAADALFANGKTDGTIALVAPNGLGWTLTFTSEGGTATQNPV